MCRFMIHIFTHKYIYSKYIQTKHKARDSFITSPFIFNIFKKNFRDRFISLVHKRKVLQCLLSFPFQTNKYSHALTNKMTYRHIHVPPIRGVCVALLV